MSALFTTNHRSRGRASVRMLGIAMTVFLVLTVLAPLLQTASAAEEDDPASLEPEISSEISAQEPDGPDGLPPTEEELDDVPAPEGDFDETYTEEVPPAEPVAFYFEKYECDSDYGHDLYELEANCYQPTIDFHFEVYGPEYSQSFVNSFGAQDLKAGLYQFQEFIPDGYREPIIFCESTDPVGYASGLTEVIAYDGYYEAQIAPGYTLYCSWYNIKDDHRGLVTVIKYECFDTLHPDATFEDYQYACTEPQEEVEFKLDGLKTGNPGSYLTDLSGVVTWDEREADTYYLTEFVPEGYGTPVFFCDAFFPFDEQQPEFFRYEVDEFGQIIFDLEAGQYFTCYVFNIPVDEHSTVTVYKYVCDEEIAPHEDLGYYQDECTEPHQYVPFNLSGESTGDQGTYETDGNGKVFWDELETDLYTLDEEIPSGYGEPIVFCGFSAYHNGAVYDGFPVRYDEVYDGAVELDIEIPNSTYVCWYFNIPEHDSSITIYKWLCPENFDLYDSAEEYCTEGYNGVEFTIDGPDGYHAESFTGDSIPYAVSFGGLEEGYYEIYETIPPGIEYGFITECWGNSNPWPAVYPLYHTDWSETFSIEIAQGDHVSCNMYNVPKHKDEGKLTVVKYLCNGYVISDLNCAIYTGGQAFTLTPAEGGAPYEFTTGANGTKTLSLPEGAWILDEVGGEWCKAKSPDLNQYGQIVTTDGHESVVYIYNCAPPSKTPPVKHPPIKQFPNTGAGPMAMSSGLSASDLAGQAVILLVVAQALVLVAIRRGGILHSIRRTG